MINSADIARQRMETADGTAETTRSPEPVQSSPLSQTVKDKQAADLLARARSTLLRMVALRNACLLAIGAGILLRMQSALSGNVASDGALYGFAAGTWVETGTTSFPFLQSGPTPTLYSLPILHLLTIVPSFLIGGVSVHGEKASGFAMSLASLGVCYLAGRNLLGDLKARIMTAFLALLPVLILPAGNGYGENTLAVTVILAMWALLKGLKRDKYFFVLGPALVGVLLSKQEVSPLLVGAGVGGYYVWRFISLRTKFITSWGTLSVGPALLGAAIFRHSLSGTSTEGAYSISGAISSGQFLLAAPTKFAFIVLIASTLAWFFAWELWGALKRVRRLEFQALWLLVLALLAIAWIESTVRSVYESANPFFSRDNQRYVFAAYIPLMVLALWDADFSSSSARFLVGLRMRFAKLRSARTLAFLGGFGISVATLFVIGEWLAGPLAVGAGSILVTSPRRRIGLLLVTFAVLGANSATATLHYAVGDAAAALDCRIVTGDVVAIDTPRDSFIMPDIYIRLRIHEITIVRFNSSAPASFVLSDGTSAYSGFQLLARFNSTLERTGLAGLLAWATGTTAVVQTEPIVSVWVSGALSARPNYC